MVQPMYAQPPIPMYLPRVQRNLQTLGILWCVLGVYRVVTGLIGMIFLMPLAGAAIGAASGAISGRLTDVGINDKFMRDAAQSLQSGNAALFLLVRKMTTDKVLAASQGEGGTVLRTSFDETKEEALRVALAGATQPSPPTAS